MSCINNHRCASCKNPCKAEIQEQEFSKWYISLTVPQKEILLDIEYPRCTEIWNNLTRDERMQIIEQSGFIRKKGNKYTALGHDF